MRWVGWVTSKRLEVVAPAASDPLSDDALMVRVAAGSTTAFVSLIERHQAALRRFCAAACGDGEAARDLAQDTFLELWRIRAGYRPEGRFKALLFTIARNKCRSFSRRRRVARLFGARAEPDRVIDPRSDRPEEERLVAAALQRLPERFRTPLMLRFVEELPYEQIAKVIGRTESSARSRVFYGLKELAALLPPEVLR